MDRDALIKQMKALKQKAKKARKEGKREMAAMFNNGTSRLRRKIKGIKVPKAATPEA